MNRDVFFGAVRKSLFLGTLMASEVKGINDLLDAIEAEPRCADSRFRAYIFATTFHETGQRMVPVREGFATTDAGAIAAVTNMFQRGRIKKNYALPDPATGLSYFGRGRVQNTFKVNYAKLQTRFDLPFVTKPDLLLDSRIDAEVTVVGHLEGIWTGKKLADYFSATVNDPVGARHIVNGTDRATTIAGYYDAALAAFKAAATTAPVAPAPAPTPLGAGPLAQPSVITPSPKPEPVVQKAFWTRFVGLLTRKAG